MTNEFMRERALQRKYPIGTKGRLSPKDDQTLTHLLIRGWEPSFVVTVELAYISAESVDCLHLRWGVGQDDWAGVLSEGFEPIEMNKTSII